MSDKDIATIWQLADEALERPDNPKNHYERDYDYYVREESIDRKYNNADWELIHDMTPTEEGGFNPGSRFLEKEFRSMLELHVVAEGSIFKNINTGNLYKVDYEAIRLDLIDKRRKAAYASWKSEKRKKGLI